MKLILTEQQYKLLLKEAQIPSVADVLGSSTKTFIEKFGENAAGQLQENKTIEKNILKQISKFLSPKKAKEKSEAERFTCQDCGNPDYKMYMVNDDVWKEFGTGKNTLCLDCLKKRMAKAGRPLKKADFSEYLNVPVNIHNKEVQNFLNS